MTQEPGHSLRNRAPYLPIHKRPHHNLPGGARDVHQRMGWDSNPRYAFDVYTVSSGAPSTTRPPIRDLRDLQATTRRARGPARLGMQRTG